MMYLLKIYDPGALAYRVRYAIATIMRDRIVNEGALQLCFEMDSNDEVVRTILRRGLKNPELRAALAKADFLAAGDKDLLTLGTYKGTRIVTPSEYLRAG